MWHAFKAEIEYNTTAAAIFAIVVVLSIMVALRWDGGSVYAVITNTSLAVLVVYIFMWARRGKEHYVRRATVLPQSLSALSWSRMLTIGAFQAVVLAVWLVMYFAFHVSDDPSAIWRLFSSNAILVTTIVLCMAYKDVRSFGNRVATVTAWFVSLALIFVMCFSFANGGNAVLVNIQSDAPFVQAFSRMLRSPAGAFVANLVMVGSVLGTHRLYLSRHSYLR